MKKRIIACILCLAIVLGMAPAAFAEDDSMTLFAEPAAAQGEQLPAGHGQLYVNGRTSVSKSAETTGTIKFRLTPDGELLGGEGWTPSYSNDNMGSLEYDGNNWRWYLGGVAPGTTGYLTLTDEAGKSYSIYAEVGPAIVGIYTRSSFDPDFPGEGYLVENDGCHTVSYSGMDGTRAVYAIPGLANMTILQNSADCTNADQVDLTILENGALEIALKEDVLDKTVSTEVFFTVLETYEDGADELEFKYTIVFETEAEPSFTLPDGHEQLYIYGEPSITGTAAGRRGLMLSLTADGDALTGEGWTPSCSDNDLGSLEYEDNDWHWNLNRAIPGASGYLIITNEEGQSYSIFANVRPAVIGIYTQDSIDPNDPGVGYLVRNDGCYTVSYDGMEGTRAVYAIPGFENMTLLEDTVDCTNADQVDLTILENGVLEIALKSSVQNRSVSTEVSFTVLETYDGGADELEFEYTIVFESESEQEPNFIPAHELHETEILPEKWRDYEECGAGPVRFEYDGEYYYVGRGMFGQPYDFGGHSPNWEDIVRNESEIAFWTMDKEGNYSPVEDKALLNQLRAQFTSLTLTVYADHNIDTEAHSAMYPAAKYRADGTVEYTFTNQHSGRWVYVVEGALADSTKLISFSWFSYRFQKETVFEPTSVDEANDYLAYIISDCPADVNYVVQLPAGTLEGILKIPAYETWGDWRITIRGATDEDGTLLTTLKGGIDSNASGCALENLILQGAGKSYETWPNGIAGLEGHANIGLSGTSTAYYYDCVFRDYHTAVLCTKGLRFGGASTHFINNGTGIHVNTSKHNGGQACMDMFYFEGNDTALWIEQLEHHLEDVPMSKYEIVRTRFVDNKCDIKNNTGKKFFAAGNYFEHNGNSAAAMDGNLRPWLKGKVYIAPIYTAWDVDDNGEIVLYDLYWGKHATVKNGETDNYALYAQELSGMTLSVIDRPDASDETTVTFQFGETASTFMLRARRDPETFDASVKVEKTEHDIAVTINELPRGPAPTLTVSCGDWTDAMVTFDGMLLESAISDGNVSFLAEQGGIYIITNTTLPKYTILFDANGGNGTMTSETVSSGTEYILPACSFNAPAEHQFKSWAISGVAYQPHAIYTVTSDIIVQAIWEEILPDTPALPESPNEPEQPEEPEEPERPERPHKPVRPSIPDIPKKPESETIYNEDGSMTTIVTDKGNGTVTETTGYQDGTVLTVLTTADGKQEINVAVPVGIVSEITIPASKVGMGTVAVILHEDGREEVIPYSIPGENALTITLQKSAQIKIVENALTFSDISDNSWFRHAVDFVSARGIMTGIGKDSFGHDETTSRAMVWTMLARLNGSDTSGGTTWYEKGLSWAIAHGISDGTNADGSITREQLAVMLWRLEGSPKVYDPEYAKLDTFSDESSVSSYAQQAMAWAVSRGIINGTGNGSLNPGGNATRAQLAQMLMNYMMNL